MAAAGDRLDELYRTYGPTIFERCRRLLRDASAAEDATQEVFLRVFRHLDRVPKGREALAWIYRVASNYCLNEIRDQKLRPQAVAELPEHGWDGFEGRLLDGELMNRLMSDLDAETRLIVQLHFFDGLDQGAVARVAGLSRRTVVYRLGELRERLRAMSSETTT